MRLTRIYVRFYKSFNFDYERKAHPSASEHAWEAIEQGWYPYVRIDLDPSITAIVGANEAGKSHLLDAVKKLLTGQDVVRRDFCRYSTLYSVETGELRTPDFGGEFILENDRDTSAASEAGLPKKVGDSILFFRPGGEDPFVLAAEGGDPLPLTKDGLASLMNVMPQWAELRTEIALPDAVPIATLAGRPVGVLKDRGLRARLLALLTAKPWQSAEEFAQQQSKELFDALAESPTTDAEEQELGRQLLVEIAQIDQASFRDLEEAMRAGREGEVNGLIQQMNDSIARHLNLRRWWSQDHDFQLRVSPREHELVFTIRDRTGTDYSFSERSRGLRYFLSYYVQLLAHQRPVDLTELLLMDEPDAYLSSSGQQDLLRILEHYARPDDGSRCDQVLYVTHSPFLINRNAGHRIRVVDKGRNEEGTRVVRDASKNNYEPLRSSLGPFVAETAFIGGMNLMVEGLADQVLLAGISNFLRKQGVASSECFDLNEVTLVPSGSAASIPYLVYLARGRDEVKPPCVVLLDSDQAGDDARKKLLRSEASGKQVLRTDLIVQLGDWAAGRDLVVESGISIREPEDLIPLDAAVVAARRYGSHMVRLEAAQVDSFGADAIRAVISAGRDSLFDALDEAFANTFPGSHIDKVGFAKELIGALEGNELPESASTAITGNFAPLVTHLSTLLHDAANDEEDQRTSRRVDRVVTSFARDYSSGSTRDRANVALREIEASLSGGKEDETTLIAIVGLRRDFALADNPNSPVENYTRFLERLNDLRYQRRLGYQDASTYAPTRATTPTRRTAKKAPAQRTRRPRELESRSKTRSSNDAAP